MDPVINPAQTTPDPAAPPKNLIGGFEHRRIYQGEGAPPDHFGPDTEAPSDVSPAPEPTGTTSAPPDPTPPPAAALPAETKPVFRHKTHEEAEKSYAHLLSKTTKVEQENARLRAEKEARIAAEEQQRRTAAETLARETFLNKRYKEAMEELSALDQDDPNYTAKSAKIWARVHGDVIGFQPEAQPPTLKSEDVLPTVSSLLPSPAGSAPEGADVSPPAPLPTSHPSPVEGEGSMDSDPETLKTIVATRIVEQQAGFDADDPVFVYFASKAPAVDETNLPLPFDVQVDWAIAQTKAHLAKQRQKILQAEAQPMSRGGTIRSNQSPPAKRKTLSDVIDGARSKRVL